jgi:hypothetical protein
MSNINTKESLLELGDIVGRFALRGNVRKVLEAVLIDKSSVTAKLEGSRVITQILCNQVADMTDTPATEVLAGAVATLNELISEEIEAAKREREGK